MGHERIATEPVAQQQSGSRRVLVAVTVNADYAWCNGEPLTLSDLATEFEAKLWHPSGDPDITVWDNAADVVADEADGLETFGWVTDADNDEGSE